MQVGLSQVGFGSGQSGRRSKLVIFKLVNWVAGQIGLTCFAMSNVYNTRLGKNYDRVDNENVFFFFF